LAGHRQRTDLDHRPDLPASFAVTLGRTWTVLAEGPARGRRVLLVLAEALAESALRRYGIEQSSILRAAKVRNCS
jgi:isoleucyl-tRNA synthetase